ncbi:hypothetical protein [Pseudoxanthomonas sp.]|uniref:hypothetical protein n=1 Tax=Pseudoxanthomonas sp. TaxID=1871049 RepID=UPI0026064F51|nr:hypothetical protein [Pseudoxanthomonas sp.]WDS36249.1 MAG: hypothetical protein O8I58_18590 [Pseudoxanthomonas sp.]
MATTVNNKSSGFPWFFYAAVSFATPAPSAMRGALTANYYGVSIGGGATAETEAEFVILNEDEVSLTEVA